MGGQYKGYMYVRMYLHTYISQFELVLHLVSHQEYITQSYIIANVVHSNQVCF